MSVSAHYQKIKPVNEQAVFETLEESWRDPEIPTRHYDSTIKDELEAFRNRQPSAPFDAFIRLLAFIPAGPKTLLDVGAAMGHYSEILKIRGFQDEYDYTALDYSTYYKDLALQLYPDIKFEIGTALELPFESKTFDMVLHGACLTALRQHERAIQEASRVAKSWVIMNRTPIYLDGTPTEAFLKTSYGVPNVEYHFNERELFVWFGKAGLEMRASADVFITENFAHRSYLLKVQ